jgi:hypothetical protein
VSKKQILSAIRVSARKLGRAPNQAELFKHGVRLSDIRRHFAGMYDAIRAAGLTPRFRGPRFETAALLTDWGRVARKMGDIPTRDQYQRAGEYTCSTLHHRFGSWQLIPERFLRHVQKARQQDQWDDVLAMIAARWPEPWSPAQPETAAPIQAKGAARLPRRFLFKDRPVQGALIQQPGLIPGLLYEPTNEAGVLFAFAVTAHRLGFEVESLRSGFPDCHARRQIVPGRWQSVRIEFEYESRAFLAHGHDPKGCDIIVCWRHNWKNCLKEIEVIELRRVLLERKRPLFHRGG